MTRTGDVHNDRDFMPSLVGLACIEIGIVLSGVLGRGHCYFLVLFVSWCGSGLLFVWGVVFLLFYFGGGGGVCFVWLVFLSE